MLVRFFPNLRRQPASGPNISLPILRFGKRISSRKGRGAQVEIRKISNDLEDAFNEVRRLTQPYDLDQGLLKRLSDLQADFLECGKVAIRERLES
jgi:signal transduction histidine kinase